MRQPSSVIWALTKRNNSFLTKWQGQDWSHAPNNLTGQHNASQSASTLGVQAHREKAKKQFRRVFTLNLAHKPRHAIKKRKQNSQAKPAYSKIQIRKEVNHAAKTIQGLTFVNDRTKKLGLKRLARLSRSLPANLRGAAVKK